LAAVFLTTLVNTVLVFEIDFFEVLLWYHWQYEKKHGATLLFPGLVIELHIIVAVEEGIVVGVTIDVESFRLFSL
jgi:hypothetical protein